MATFSIIVKIEIKLPCFEMETPLCSNRQEIGSSQASQSTVDYGKQNAVDYGRRTPWRAESRTQWRAGIFASTAVKRENRVHNCYRHSFKTMFGCMLVGLTSSKDPGHIKSTGGANSIANSGSAQTVIYIAINMA